MTFRVQIFFGTQTGVSEELSYELSKYLEGEGILNDVVDLEDVTLQDVSKAPAFVIITSTYGNGEPPVNARDFYVTLMESSDPTLFSNSKFAVFGLGCTYYKSFNKCAKDTFGRICELGGTSILRPRYWDDAEKNRKDLWLKWMGELSVALKGL